MSLQRDFVNVLFWSVWLQSILPCQASLDVRLSHENISAMMQCGIFETEMKGLNLQHHSIASAHLLLRHI